MAGRDDRDDWFAEPEPGPAARPGPAGDDWIRDDAAAPRTGRREPFRATRSVRLAASGVGALIVLLLVLWAAGAFGGGASPPTRPAATTTQAPTTSTPAAAAPAPVPAPTTTLKPGSSGPQVKRLQRALAQLGYSPGRVDGGYGPATANAVGQFQRANGLQPDGVLGPKTLQALKNRLAAG